GQDEPVGEKRLAGQYWPGVHYLHGGGNYGEPGLRQQESGGSAAGAGRKGRSDRAQEAGPGEAQSDLCEKLYRSVGKPLPEVSKRHVQWCHFHTARGVKRTR